MDMERTTESLIKKKKQIKGFWGLEKQGKPWREQGQSSLQTQEKSWLKGRVRWKEIKMKDSRFWKRLVFTKKKLGSRTYEKDWRVERKV